MMFVKRKIVKRSQDAMRAHSPMQVDVGTFTHHRSAGQKLGMAFVVIAIASFGISTSINSFADGTSDSGKQLTSIEEARKLTNDAIALGDTKATASRQKQSASTVSSLDDQYTTVLKQRAQVIKQLLQEGQAAQVLASVLEPGGFSSVPAQAAQYIERPATITAATLQMVQGDELKSRSAAKAEYDHTKEYKEYYLEKNGSRTRLYLEKAPDVSLVNKRVSSKSAIQINDSVVMRAEEITADANQPAPLEPEAAPIKVAAIIVNIEGSSQRQYAESEVRQAVFGPTPLSAASYYKDVTYGKMQLSGVRDPVNGDVFGPYTVSKGEGCDYSLWTQKAGAQIKAAGINLNDYNNMVFFFNYPSGTCSWSGLGVIGKPGAPANLAWISSGLGSILDEVVSHELGHNFGLHHANAYICTDVAGKPASFEQETHCSSQEYGDYLDVMGFGSGHPSAFYKARLGALTDTQIQTVSKSGTYTLYPQESLAKSPASTRLLRVPMGADQWLYIEYRQPAPPYDDFVSTDNAVKGVIMRLGGDIPSYATKSQLIDMTPSSDGFAFDSTLVFGKTVTLLDRAKITAVNGTNGVATVKVELPSETGCLASAPQFVSTSAAPVSYVDPGQVKKYTVTLKNMNSANCGSAKYNVALTASAGIAKSASPASFEVAPGQTFSYTVTVRSTRPLAAHANNYVGVATSENGMVIRSERLAYKINPLAYKKPTATIKTPGNNVRIDARKRQVIAVTGVASSQSKIKKIELFVNGKRVAKENDGARLKKDIKTGSLRKGKNTIALIATDTYGNSDRHAVTVTIDK